jgi:threonine dehydrogenase-like Zn-dependent dehydrogenase
MKAIVVAKYGSPDGLQLKEVEKPTPKANEVLIKIHATTVTFGDAMLRSFSGLRRMVFGIFFGLKTDKILGHELSGEIESVGKDVTRFAGGDDVFASTGTKSGAYAEYISLPEDGMLAVKPTNMTYQEAAAVPVGWNAGSKTDQYDLSRSRRRSSRRKYSTAYPPKRKHPEWAKSTYLWCFWKCRYLCRTARQALWGRGYWSLPYREF